MLLRELQAQYPRWQDASTLTVREFLALWMESIHSSRSVATIDSYQRAIRRLIEPAFGAKGVASLGSLEIQHWLDRLDVGSRTRQNCYAVLTAALNKAVTLGVIRANPCNAVEKPRHQRKPIRPFTTDECRAILRATKDDRLAGVYRLGLICGMRYGEIAALEWSRIQDGRIAIAQSLSEVAGSVSVKEPKSRASNRTIDVPGSVWDALNRRRADAMREGHAGCSWVFPNTKGGVMRRSNFSNRKWRPLLRQLGLDHRGFHHARHTAATLMLSAGEPVIAVAGLLGHSSSVTTQRIYEHWIPSVSASAVNTLSKKLGDS